jgi:hypothetical protein
MRFLDQRKAARVMGRACADKERIPLKNYKQIVKDRSAMVPGFPDGGLG